MMRSKRNRRPRWTTLGLILIAGLGLLAAQHTLHLTPLGHKIALFLIIAVIYGLMGLWVKSNAPALEELDAEEYRRQSRDPAVYGTPQFPTRTQANFKAVTSFYRHESPDKREKF